MLHRPSAIPNAAHQRMRANAHVRKYHVDIETVQLFGWFGLVILTGIICYLGVGHVTRSFDAREADLSAREAYTRIGELYCYSHGPKISPRPETAYEPPDLFLDGEAGTPCDTLTTDRQKRQCLSSLTRGDSLVMTIRMVTEYQLPPICEMARREYQG